MLFLLHPIGHANHLGQPKFKGRAIRLYPSMGVLLDRDHPERVCFWLAFSVWALDLGQEIFHKGESR